LAFLEGVIFTLKDFIKGKTRILKENGLIFKGDNITHHRPKGIVYL